MTEPTPNSTGFVLFSPDATTTGLYRDAVSFLEQHGFTFVAFKWVEVDQSLLDLLYRRNRQRPSPSVDHSLVDRLFNLGASLAGCVRYSGYLGKSTAPCILKQLKGNSDPTRLEPHHLRAVLGAGNKVMNYIHASDTVEEAGFEAGLFFPERAIYADHGSAILPPPPDGLGLRNSVNVFSTLFSAKLRLLEQCCPRGWGLASLFIERERPLACERRVDAASRKAIFDLWRRQITALESEVDLSAAHKLLLKRLMAENLSAWAYPKLIPDLESAGVFLSTWDKLILDCQFTQGQLL